MEIVGGWLPLVAPLIGLALLFLGYFVLSAGRKDDLRQQHDTWDMGLEWGVYDRRREE